MSCVSGVLAQNIIYEGPCATATRRQNGDIIRARQYTYDTTIRLDSVTETERGNLTSVTRYTYGDQGQLVREELFNRNNDLASSVLYSYEDGRLIERSERERDRLRNYIEYVYDSAGRLTRELVYNRGDELIQRNEFSYEGNGERRIRQERFDDRDRLLETLEYSYDERGNLTLRTRTNRGGDLVEELEYSYDESGNITTVRRREGRDVLTTSYDYGCFQ
jgi:YD repeat-containing protein